MGAKKGLLADFLQAGELHMVAGVKGVGKTTLLLNIAEEFQRDREGFISYITIRLRMVRLHCRMN